MKSIIRTVALICLNLSLTSCGGGGGGGGGDEFVGAASLSVTASPSEIDSGDRTEVKIEIIDVHPDGAAIKVRFPKGLKYVASTSLLDVYGDGETGVDVSPRINKTKDNDTYLVYYFSLAQMGETNQGQLSFQLEGVSEVSDGEIEVDADVDDPNTPNSSEFNINRPEFGAEDSTSIEVIN